MAFAIAHVYGHTHNTADLKTDIYIILAGNSAKEALKTAGIQITKEITKKAPKAQRPSTPIKIVNNRNGNNVELPPKRGEKIQLETFDIPIPKGECICGPEEACLICMEQKDLVN